LFQPRRADYIRRIMSQEREDLISFQGVRLFFKTTLEAPDHLLDRLVQDATAFLNVQSPPRLPGTLLWSAENVIRGWSVADQTSFIHGHPRIGEIAGLSVLSAQEQAQKATPQHVLDRLGYLNEEYERRYPGLRYITFVNGRSRAEIATEMEQKLDLQSGETAPLSETTVYQVGSPEWSGELDRALKDIALIALSRSKNM